jgi:UDP-glucuronate 4-epimerase
MTDITNYAALRKIFEANEITHIIHLAAKAGERSSLEMPEEYFKTNINGTVNLLQLAKEFDVQKFIFASSSSVYGARKSGPFKEDMKIDKLISPNAVTKAAGEQICYTYSHLYRINTVCLRFFTVYGPKQRPDSVIHKFSRLIAEKKPLPVFGDGTTVRDYVYVDDVIQGILASIDYDKSRFEIFNLGEANPIRLKHLITMLEEIFGQKAKIEKRLLQPGDVKMTYADISKSRELLGYKPSTSLKRGLKKFTAWFKEFYSYSPV